MKTTSTNKLVIGLLFLAALFSSGCPDDTPTTPNGGSDGMEFTGLVRYAVSSTSDIIIQDTVHGLRLKVVGGGQGEISIEKASKVEYAAPDSAPVFRIKNPQLMKLQLLVTRSPGVTPVVALYAAAFGSTYESTSRSKEWIGLARSDTSSNPAVYELFIPTASMHSKGSQLQVDGSADEFIIAQDAKENQARADYLNKCIDLVRSSVQTIINPIASPYKEQAMTEVNGRLMPKADLAILSSVSYYNPFYSLAGLYVNPHFCFVYKKNERELKSTVAHESGHYISHVLLGDEKMRTIQANAIRHHDIGDVHPNRILTEEYSQFADLTVNASVKGIPLADFYTNVRGNKSPRTVDFVAKEGYITMLLGWLHSSVGIINNAPDGSNTAGEDYDNMPTLQSSYGELWTILAQHKPLSADDLYNAFKATYTPEKMKVIHTIMQRTGWNYSVNGKLTWTTGEAVKNVVVQPIMKIGTSVYTAAEDTTNENGDFTLPCGFPVSEVQLRIKLSGKTILPDLDTIISLSSFTPARKTSEAVSVGTIAIQPPVVPPVFGQWEIGSTIASTPSCTPCGASNESFPLSLGGKYYLSVDGQGNAVFAGGNSNIVDYESAEISGTITVNSNYRYLSDARYIVNLSYNYRRDYANALLKISGAITSSQTQQTRYRGSLQFTVWEDQRKLKEVCNCSESVDAFSSVSKSR